MKICIVSTESRYAVGGLAAYMRRLARVLVDAGHGVSAVSRFDRGLPGPLDYADGEVGVARADDGVPSQLIGPARWARRSLPRLRHFTGRKSVRGVAPWLFGVAYGRQMAAAVPVGVEIVHYIGTGHELLGFVAMRVARKRAAAFTVWPAVHPGTWGDSPLDIDLYDRADAVFCQSDHEVEHLAALGVARHRLVRAWLAPVAEPDGDGAAFRQRHGLADRALILFIGRKCRSKGFHTVCEAMAKVAMAIPAACLVAIGPEGERPYPPVSADAYLDLGVACEKEKADALAACDVFCMPSSAESFGIVYVEAWGYGKPVIGGPATAVQELIGDGAAGVALDRQDAGAVAAALIDLFQNSSLRQQMGKAGAQLVQDKYNWPAVYDLHMNTFQRLRSEGTC